MFKIFTFISGGWEVGVIGERQIQRSEKNRTSEAKQSEENVLF